MMCKVIKRWKSLIMALIMCCLSALGTFDMEVSATELTDEIIRGADIGFLSQLENNGVQWIDDNGQTQDALSLLKAKGVNAVRLRVFVRPNSDFMWTKPDGTTCMLGYADTTGLLYTAQRAKALGMKIMVVFHYSDHFADPLYQDVPSEWTGASTQQLESYVYDYTEYIMTQLANVNVYPEWVQVGNEVSYGVLYPSGTNQNNDFTQMTRYLNSGYDAVKAVSPNTKVVTHLTHGSGINHFNWFFENFITTCGGKTDVIGMSYYPYWTSAYDGDCIENVAYNLNKMAAKYGKEVMICETGEMETNPSATYSLLRKELNAIKAVPNGKGIGVFVWEPEAHSSVTPDEYVLGACESVGNKTLHFTYALNAFSTDADYLNNNVMYELQNINSGHAINVSGGSLSNEAQIEQYGYGDWSSQKWKIENVDGDYYVIKNVNSGKVLDVAANSTAVNASVIQYDYNGGWNQQWKIIETSDGYTKIQNRLSGLYLGVFSNSTYEQAWVVQVSENEASTKWFMLVAD